MEYTTAEKFLNDVIAQRNMDMLMGIHEPELVIYMNEKAWSLCTHELHSQGEKKLADELSKCRVYGQPVYLVRALNHADYEIYSREV